MLLTGTISTPKDMTESTAIMTVSLLPTSPSHKFDLGLLACLGCHWATTKLDSSVTLGQSSTSARMSAKMFMIAAFSAAQVISH